MDQINKNASNKIILSLDFTIVSECSPNWLIDYRDTKIWIKYLLNFIYQLIKKQIGKYKKKIISLSSDLTSNN